MSAFPRLSPGPRRAAKRGPPLAVVVVLLTAGIVMAQAVPPLGGGHEDDRGARPAEVGAGRPHALALPAATLAPEPAPARKGRRAPTPRDRGLRALVLKLRAGRPVLRADARKIRILGSGWKNAGVASAPPELINALRTYRKHLEAARRAVARRGLQTRRGRRARQLLLEMLNASIFGSERFREFARASDRATAQARLDSSMKSFFRARVFGARAARRLYCRGC